MKVAEPWGGEENETFLMLDNGREAVCPSMTSEWSAFLRRSVFFGQRRI
jgi:hypothetical protein